MKFKPLASEKVLTRMLEEASRQHQRGLKQDYIETLNRILKLRPGDSKVLLQLGSAYGQCFKYAAAEEAFEQAINNSRNKSKILEAIALECRNFARFEMAERYLERAVEQLEVSADTLTKLAEIYERFRRVEKANFTVDRALKLDATNPLALLVKARLLRSSGDLASAESLLRSFLDRSDTNSWSTRIRGWYELGANLDRQARYDDAFAAITRAKDLIRPESGKMRAFHGKTQEELREAARDITADVLQKWSTASVDSVSQSQPLAIICGFPRSGTTLLEQMLDSHPSIVSAEETIILYEAYAELARSLPAGISLREALDIASPVLLKQSRDSYLANMQSFVGTPIGNRLLVDKNPSMTSMIPAMIRLFPQTRFIVALRDPRDVCLSCFFQALPINPTTSTYLTIEDTAREYASLMGFYVAIRDRLPNPSLEVKYENVVHNPKEAVGKALSYLNLNWDERVLQFDEHAMKKLVRSPTYAEVAKPITKTAVGRWRNYEKFLLPAIDTLKPLMEVFGYSDQ